MLVQVVHAHPLTDSYNHALFRTIVEALESQGHQVIATDLYRDGFDPRLRESERGSYFGPRYDVTGVTEYVDILRRIDAIVFCFPQWWFGLPAILKGYFDRVWGPGIAFTPDAAGGRIKPLLFNIKLFGVVTSYGSPWWVVRFYAGDPTRKMLMRALKPMCGGRVRSFYLAHYDMDRSTGASRDRFMLRVQARVPREVMKASDAERMG
jgi:putative NADPH-quinone reductase